MVDLPPTDADLQSHRGVTLSSAHCQVPRACDLGQVVPQLAALRCYEGVIDLPLAKAAALDPDRVARLPGEQGRAAQEVCTLGFKSLHPKCSGQGRAAQELGLGSRVYA